MRAAWSYLRANPQMLVLLVICLVLGIGTFLVVVISIAASGGHPTGEPEGALTVFRAATAALGAV
jgi:hypothetical protein